MGVDFATWVYEPCFNTFARTIVFYPAVSQPGVGSFQARGIFDTNEIDVDAMDGSILTNARTELDIFMPEWPVYPKQGDIVDIPWEDDVDGGTFQVADVHGFGNAGGELTLILSRYGDSKLPGYLVLAPNYFLGALGWGIAPTLGAVDGFFVGSLDFAMPVLA
jgi:hypothetical protein